MRNFKFRAWDKTRNKWKDLGEMTLFSIFESYRFEVMQNTGLKDRDKKEIYEGDILEVRNDIDWVIDKCVVEWEYFGFNMRSLKKKGSGYWSPDMTKVIGNIHEDPKLVEVT